MSEPTIGDFLVEMEAVKSTLETEIRNSTQVIEKIVQEEKVVSSTVNVALMPTAPKAEAKSNAASMKPLHKEPAKPEATEQKASFSKSIHELKNVLAKLDHPQAFEKSIAGESEQIDHTVNVTKPSLAGKSPVQTKLADMGEERTLEKQPVTKSASSQALDDMKSKDSDISAEEVAEAVQSGLGDYTKAMLSTMDAVNDSKLATAAGTALLGPFYSAMQEVYAIKDDALVKHIGGFFGKSKDKETKAPESGKETSAKDNEKTGGPAAPESSSVVQELLQIKNDSLVKRIVGSSSKTKGKQAEASKPDKEQPPGYIEKPETNKTGLATVERLTGKKSEVEKAEGAKAPLSLARPDKTPKVETSSKTVLLDQTPVVDKLDEIKDLLEDNRKEEPKRFKLAQRLEKRRAAKLLRATKKGGKGGGMLGRLLGRGIISKIPKLAGMVGSIGSALAGVAAPVAAAASAVGGIAMVGKDAFDIFKSFKEGGVEAVKGRDVGGVAGGLGGAAAGAAIGSLIFPGVGTVIGAGIGAIAGNLLGGKAGEAMEESPEAKTARKKAEAAGGKKKGILDKIGGSVAGAALGTLLFPGLGTVVGAVAGNYLGGKAGEEESPEAKAARKKEEATGEKTKGILGKISGKAIGATLGSLILPGVGTVVGGIAGHLLGDKDSAEDASGKTALRKKAQTKIKGRKQTRDTSSDQAVEDYNAYFDRLHGKRKTKKPNLQPALSKEQNEIQHGGRTLIAPTAITTSKVQRDLKHGNKAVERGRFSLQKHTQKDTLEKIARSPESVGPKKQLDSLINEIKGLRKDIKHREEKPAEVSNPMLRETIIQSKNLFS